MADTSLEIYSEILDPKVPERIFKLSYGYGQEFFLTTEERDYLLTEIQKGAKFIQIGQQTFTPNFKMLYPFKSLPDKREFEEINIKGRVFFREKPSTT